MHIKYKKHEFGAFSVAIATALPVTDSSAFVLSVTRRIASGDRLDVCVIHNREAAYELFELAKTLRERILTHKRLFTSMSVTGQHCKLRAQQLGVSAALLTATFDEAPFYRTQPAGHKGWAIPMNYKDQLLELLQCFEEFTQLPEIEHQGNPNDSRQGNIVETFERITSDTHCLAVDQYIQDNKEYYGSIFETKEVGLAVVEVLDKHSEFIQRYKNRYSLVFALEVANCKKCDAEYPKNGFGRLVCQKCWFDKKDARHQEVLARISNKIS